MSTRWGLGSDLSVATHNGGKDGGASRCAHARHHLSDLAWQNSSMGFHGVKIFLQRGCLGKVFLSGRTFFFFLFFLDIL